MTAEEEKAFQKAKKQRFDALKLLLAQVVLAQCYVWLLWYHPAWPKRVYVAVLVVNIIGIVLLAGMIWRAIAKISKITKDLH